MRIPYLIIAIWFLCFTCSLPYKTNINELNRVSPTADYNPLYQQKTNSFNQVLDHFNYQSQTFWKQRYFSIQDYFNPAVGPVFLYICGQYNCPGVPAARHWVIKLAQKLQGLILVLEHRYYGISLPFGKDSFKLQNMKYLNSEQALSDLAYFIKQIKTSGAHGIKKSPWLTVGGSYPGAMSAWFRAKYPHLTIGAIASSAVIQAIVDFQDYDEQVYVSFNYSSSACVQALKNSNDKVQEILKSDGKDKFKAYFPGAEKLTDDQFLFYWVDSFAGRVQYGSRTAFCNLLKGKSKEDQFKALVEEARLSNEVYQYGSFYISQQNSTQRSWTFQCCTQFGFWQTPSDRHPLRPKSLQIGFYKKFCNDSFGVPLWPSAYRKNIEYGGVDIQATRLLMVNGVQDPWRWASLQHSKGDIVSRIANCPDCAHCCQLYTPDTKDSSVLKTIRNQQYLKIDAWIQEYWRNKKQVNLKKTFRSLQ